MPIKLYDSELKIMEVLWQYGDITAKELARILSEETGWNKNTSYTVLKKCIAKAAVERQDPHFVCHALIPREAVQEYEVNELIKKYFDGSAEMMFSSFVSSRKLPQPTIKNLIKLLEKGGEEK